MQRLPTWMSQSSTVGFWRQGVIRDAFPRRRLLHVGLGFSDEDDHVVERPYCIGALNPNG